MEFRGGVGGIRRGRRSLGHGRPVELPTLLRDEAQWRSATRKVGGVLGRQGGRGSGPSAAAAAAAGRLASLLGRNGSLPLVVGLSAASSAASSAAEILPKVLVDGAPRVRVHLTSKRQFFKDVNDSYVYKLSLTYICC